ncbi:MAG: 2Fe-2S iron-sulfur cluster binding domain-containing protein [Rhodanobacter sp.]|jgi:CDP-4-dehydro-6-deoxyglucose reductase|nr:2Fe-2S iron-sulfur cluster binding domain-containing protein [Rhodanobacter sp.]
MKTITLSPSGQSVPVNEGDTVLMAVERGGYALPNNCRAGTCGECKVRVLEGEVDQGFVLDMALPQAERQQGYRLVCVAKPISDQIVLEWGAADAAPKLFPPRVDMPYLVVDRIPRTPRIVELHLMPLGTPMRFWPGQYVAIKAPSRPNQPRHYSLARAPRPDGLIVLQITRVDGGVTSTWLHENVAIGATLPISGPYGTFIGDPKAETPVLCLAAGSGQAPILSLADAALRRGYSSPVTLIFSARTADDIYGQGLLAYWTLKHRNFKSYVTLTREQRSGLLNGHIPEILPGLFPDLAGYSVFIAGSPAFSDACVTAVKQLGARDEQLNMEKFVDQNLGRHT